MRSVLGNIDVLWNNTNAVRKKANAVWEKTGSIFLSQGLGLFFGVARGKDAGFMQSKCRVHGKVCYQQCFESQMVVCSKCRVAEFLRIFPPTRRVRTLSRGVVSAHLMARPAGSPLAADSLLRPRGPLDRCPKPQPHAWGHTPLPFPLRRRVRHLQPACAEQAPRRRRPLHHRRLQRLLGYALGRP